MSNSWLWLTAFVLLFTLLDSAKFMADLRKQAQRDKDARSLQMLTLIWLFLVLAQCSALFALHIQLPSAQHIDSALGWWALTSLILVTGAGISLPVRPLKKIRLLMLYAIAAHGVLLFTWVLSLIMPSVPRTLPVDITLALGALAAIALGIFTLTVPREVKLAK